MSTFKVRQARRGDAAPITAMMLELGFTGDAATVTWIISHPEMELLVAADSFDKAIGIICLAHRPQIRFGGRIATIEELMVTLPWRRKGVGRELLKRAIERSRVLGVKRLEVQTLKANEPTSMAFFASCGFVAADASVLRLA